MILLLIGRLHSAFQCLCLQNMFLKIQMKEIIVKSFFSLKFCIETVSGESDHVFLKAVHQLLLSLTAIHKLVRDQIQARPLTAKIFSVGFDFLSLKVSQAGLKVFSTGLDVLKMSQAGLVSCHRAKLLVIWLSSCPSNTFKENQVFWKIVNLCI